MRKVSAPYYARIELALVLPTQGMSTPLLVLNAYLGSEAYH